MRCRICHLAFEGEDVALMFKHWNASGETRVFHTCNACAQLRRDTRKGRDRFMVKARSTIQRHCRRWNERSGEALTPGQFSQRFGWRPRQVAHDLEHAYANGCPYCFAPFATMAHGLADLTLDVIDPRRQPWYSTNVRPCCSTCNREKTNTPPDQWERKRQLWTRWRERPAAPEQMSLFDA